MSEINEEMLKLANRDKRLMVLAQTEVNKALSEFLDKQVEQITRRHMHDVALTAVTGAITRIYEEDGEIKYRIEEANRYRKVAEDALNCAPRQFVIPAPIE